MRSIKGSLAGLVLAGIMALAPVAAIAHGGGGGGHGGGGGGFGGGGFGGGGGHFGGGGAGHFAGASHFSGFAGHSFAGHGFTGRGFAGHEGARFAMHGDHFRRGDHFRHDGNFFFGGPFFYDYPYGYDQYYNDNTGDYSQIVIAVQQQLTQLGYYHGPVDGSIGPETEGAIRWFQSVDNLPVTGQIDDQTLRALGIS